ncbi:MAG: oligosaccharide flippase family protein [Chloroflexi bacterium]|nr:oligosaccharide flippase family protein [Chloroflexota bacterium]
MGAALLAALALAWVFRGPALAFADGIVQSSDLAAAAFDSGRMFFSYEFRNVLLFAIFLIGAGAVVGLARRAIFLPARWGGYPLWQPLATGVLVLDLFIVGIGFYPKTDPRLGQFTPPAVEFLRQDQSYYRITSYDKPDEKVFNPNAGMLYGLSDIRGYDSIIPKQYAELMGLLAPQDELLYNRIAPFYSPDPLSSPLINLLNVKYVLTTRPLPNAGYTLVYDKEIQIYQNDRVLPRAFMVPQARVIADRAALLAEMKQFDPAREVLLEQDPGIAAQEIASACALNPVEIVKYSGSEVVVKSAQVCAGWLVLSDSYFPGWIAQIDGEDAPLYRADYNFRGVHVPAGEHLVRFKYSPVSFRAGLIGSFLGAMLVLLGFAYLAWQRFYRVNEGSEVQVVAKNSLLPMATSLLMKAMDLAFALFSLRVLGPTGTGRYAWAVGIWLFANTITDFGLGILLTREVSRDRSQANRYLTNSLILRVVLWALSLIPFGIIAAIYVSFFNVTLDTAFALGLLLIGILPSTLSASLAFLFNAYERFEYRVAVDVVTRIVSITLGVIALLLGYGYVGLAAVSILTNLFTLAVFYWLVRATLFAPRLQVDRGLIRWMAFESYPLMLNNLLSSLFFRIDAMILLPLKGDTVLGYYSTAYKFIEALNFIPSNFTLAIFPALSRLASSAKDAMLRAYTLSLKILLWVSLPLTVGTIFVSRELIQIFGGDAYLPHSAIALQALIWFLPFSFINSVTHYVLIALGQQRFLTKAFVVGVVFNIVANLIAIGPLSYVGAALVTILSEIVLLIPFYYSVRKNLASIPFWSITWRPALAAGLMGLALWWLVERAGVVVAVPIAGLVYGVLLIALGALGEDERALLRRLRKKT